MCAPVRTRSEREMERGRKRSSESESKRVRDPMSVYACVRAREGASEEMSIRIFCSVVQCVVQFVVQCEVQCGVQCAAVCFAVCVAAGWSSDRSLGMFKQVRNFCGAAFFSSLTLHPNEHAASHHNVPGLPHGAAPASHGCCYHGTTSSAQCPWCRQDHLQTRCSTTGPRRQFAYWCTCAHRVIYVHAYVSTCVCTCTCAPPLSLVLSLSPLCPVLFPLSEGD